MNMKKVLALALALVLIVGATVAGTVAWLTAKTSDVVNTFTTSDIGVNLQETTTDYKMIPGCTIDKDPVAKITADSEDAFLFIKVVENGGTVDGTSYNFDSFIAYAIDSGWTALDATNHPGVYYMVIDEDDEKNKDYPILAGGTYESNGETYTWGANELLTKPEVTKEMMEAVKDNEPKLTFTAYAHQLHKDAAENDDFTAAQAWANLNP